MGLTALLPVAGDFISTLLGIGSQNRQAGAAGQLFGAAASDYGQVSGDYQPYMGSSLATLNQAATRGLGPQAYTSAMGRSMEAADQNIASARNALGMGVPNIAGKTGDMLDSAIRGEASTAAQLAGENQMFKTQAAGELAGMGTQAMMGAAQGLSGLGQEYMQSATAGGNPFSNFLSFITGMGPGGSTATSGGNSFLQMLGGLFGGGGGGAPAGGAGGSAFSPGGAMSGAGGGINPIQPTPGGNWLGAI